MKGAWAGSLGLSLGLWLAGAGAQEIRWRPSAAPVPESTASAPLATLGRPVATLGRPVPSVSPTDAPLTDANLTRTDYTDAILPLPAAKVRAQAPELSGPTLAPPSVGGIPATPDERYNCGVVNQPPGARGGFFSKFKNPFSGLSSPGGSDGVSGVTSRSPFQSDHAFDQFASPVSDPFFFEDPRALTEVRPIFIYQQAPGSNYVYHAGDIVFLGTQARVAFTDWFSLVMNKFGGIWSENHNAFDGFAPHAGFAEVWLGPKFTFYRCEQTGTVAAAGLTFQIPAGPGRVFQDTGTLTLNPYLSFAQNFGRSSYGSFNFMHTSGLAIATDNKRTDYGYADFHLDYNVLNANKIYPLIELDWTHINQAGSARALGFEGRDLFNYGSTAVSGRDYLVVATGARYKFNECIQVGAAVSTPITAPRDIYGYRINGDLIFRY